MLTKEKVKDLYKQGYRVVGNHSSIKVCLWTKKAIRCEDVCYKKTFYNINSHRCVQMTPALQFCSNRCNWCWRDIEFTQPKWAGPVDEPSEIIDNCIKEHVKYIQGFGGTDKSDREKYAEAQHPLHFAISLSGEPTLYPKLPEFIKELKNRKISSFLVTNGTNPEMLKQLINQQPTQLYITLPAPDEQTYERICSPLVKNQWEKILESINLMNKFKRNTLRLTLAKDVNLIKPEKYAELIKQASPQFIEAKAYVWVGHSKQRLEITNMPIHSEIIDFAKKISSLTNFKIVDDKKESRVVLLMKDNFESRFLNY
ncbi:MAG: 4-demethylwyosine synthase TYW1 [Candidatus Woesearchaeota archaeon]|jgi:tRNA wybutosine-synthesizing protein 1|nr:4-demethylwyosine synthase TYW1 [Candidatus Woesearchaeota archaeon]